MMVFLPLCGTFVGSERAISLLQAHGVTTCCLALSLVTALEVALIGLL